MALKKVGTEPNEGSKSIFSQPSGRPALVQGNGI